MTCKRKVETKKLQAELRTKSEKIRELPRNWQRKRQKREIYLANKPLPKTPTKFKIFKEKVKSKFQHLIEKTKHQNQKLVARIEVATK